MCDSVFHSVPEHLCDKLQMCNCVSLRLFVYHYVICSCLCLVRFKLIVEITMKLLTLSVLHKLFYFVPSAEYVYTGLCCITLRMSVDFYQQIPR